MQPHLVPVIDSSIEVKVLTSNTCSVIIILPIYSIASGVINITTGAEVHCFMRPREVFERGLAAILPIYEGGNVTKIISLDGTDLIDKRTIRTVLKDLASFYGTDLVACRKQYGRFINKTNSVPIPLAANLVLTPVKIRERPLGKNDGTLGYINFQEIVEVKDEPLGRCTIVLKSGRCILTKVTHTTMMEYIKNARLVERMYLNRHFYGNNFSGVVKEVETEYGDSGIKQMCPWERPCQYDETFLRGYLMELLMEIIRLQKNQAYKA